MYYEELQSYTDTVDQATRFEVHVVFKDGSLFNSTAMPIAHLKKVIADIEASDAARTAITLWNRDQRALVTIPHDNILSVSILFAAK